MKSTLIFCLTLFSFLISNAQNTNCSPTLSEIYDFEIGDVFHYSNIYSKADHDGTTLYHTKESIEILNKKISGDTTTYYRKIVNSNTTLDTLVLIDDSTHILNMCDSSFVRVNSLSYYKNFPAGVEDIYSLVRVYKNDTVRTWDNDYPRIVKATGIFSHNDAFYIKSDSGSYEPIDANFNGPHFLVEYAAGVGLLFEGHDDFESGYERRLIHKINGTDTTVYHTAAIHKSQLKHLQFSAFPNPVKDKLTLKFDNANLTNYTIINAMGQIIKSGELQGLEQTIHLKDLPAGIYFINTETAEASGSLRFIKE